MADGQSLFDYDVGLNDIIQIFVRPKILSEQNGHSEQNGIKGLALSNGHTEANGHTKTNGHTEVNGHAEVNGCVKTVNGESVTTPTSNGSIEETMETVCL